jgi:hypothetical protein
MITDHKNAPQAAGTGGHKSPLVVDLAPLVQIMLGVINRCHDALLQEDFETLHVLRGTLAHLCGPQPPMATDGVTWSIMCHELDRLLDHVLKSPDQPQPQRALLGPAAQSDLAATPASWRNLAHQDELALWFHSLGVLLRESHPRAIEMLRLRFSGLGSRAIADRLKLPFRLVEQVLTDLRQRGVQLACAQEPAA